MNNNDIVWGEPRPTMNGKTFNDVFVNTKEKRNFIHTVLSPTRRWIRTGMVSPDPEINDPWVKTIEAHMGMTHERVRDYLGFDGLGVDDEEATFDHVIPMAAARTRNEIWFLQHWSNLCMMTSEENVRKGDSLPEWEELHPRATKAMREILRREKRYANTGV